MTQNLKSKKEYNQEIEEILKELEKKINESEKKRDEILKKVLLALEEDKARKITKKIKDGI